MKRYCLLWRIGLCLLLSAGLSVSCRDIEIEPEVPQQQEPEKPEEPETPKEPETPQEPETPEEPEKPETPVADLLDIEFFSDGSAKDISASAMAVKHVEGADHINYLNNTYSRYVAHFNHTLGAGINAGFYSISYAGKTDFRSALADGHTVEALFKMDEASDGSKEIKPFSSMEKGGTGFLITKAAKGTDITFLPNISTNGSSNWIWTQSGVTPEAGKYYHVVGVWNKEEKKTYIYIDGQLKGSADANGEFVFPSSGAEWFCIGGDASTSASAQAGFKGDVAIARVYDAPLSAEDVNTLWQAVKVEGICEGISLSDIAYLPEATVKTGCYLHVYGKGFKDGDIVRLESVNDGNICYDCGTVLTDDCIKIQIPVGIISDNYRMVLDRGKCQYPIGNIKLTVASELKKYNPSKIIAHRGYHPGKVAENSMESLIEAQKVGAYGSEFDVFVTTDDVLVLYHDAKLSDGRRIDACSYEELKNYTLGNGEKIPTFEQYLEQGKKYPYVRLICEIKTHENAEKNMRAVAACVAAVKKHDMVNQVDYIAFDYNICKKLVELSPGTFVQYVNGDKAPSVVLADGIRGIDYKMTKLTDAWIKEAHDLGMVVNVWTVDNASDMLLYISKGVDFITTNESETGLLLTGRTYISE